MGQKYINTVCFIRTSDYYGVYQPENLAALQAQMALYNRLGLAATYLLEYDALTREEFRNVILENKKPEDELGLWFEITGGLCADAGVVWRSKRNRDWDFYVDPGFIMSYHTEDKRRLCDTAMERFKEYFGCYPRTTGSWLLDSESMSWLNERYGMDAYIICREQWGMDGYTLWGGPYFGGYYPAERNMLTPAQEESNQLGVPVFRMYVSDPMYSYYEFTHGELSGIDYHLFSQEPYWRCGQDPKWVSWCLDTLFGEGAEGFSYYQLGQETSFGAGEELMKALVMQCEYALAKKEEYGYEFVTVSQMGKNFKASYRTTPENFTPALCDWAGLGNQSVWYNSTKYRVNIFVHDTELRIRDVHFFSDDYTERYRVEPCRKQWAVYDNPPLVDGVRFTRGCDEKEIPFDNDFSGKKYGEAAGLYLQLPARITGIRKMEEYCLLECNDGGFLISLYEDRIVMESRQGEFTWLFRHKEKLPYLAEAAEKKLVYCHRGFAYALVLMEGRLQGERFISENGRMTFTWETEKEQNDERDSFFKRHMANEAHR